MKILLLGGRGRTGMRIVESAAEHEVILFDGDVLDSTAVNQSMYGIDAVISVIGHVKGSPPRVQTDGIKNVVSAMHANGVRRIVSLTGTGVRMPGDKITPMDYFLNFGVGIVDPDRVQDGIAHARLLEDSDLDFTIVRVLKLTNGGLSAALKLTLNGPAKSFVSRADAAQAILGIVNDASFIRQAPIISR